MTNIINPTTTNESVVKTLRSLMPARVLSYNEALQRAELQASRLLSLHQITAPAVPIEVVTEQPRIRIVQSYDLPVSGSAHWDGRYWVVTLNAAEYDLRQRFSTLHEYKHIIDHPTRHLIQGDPRSKLSAEQMAEKVADYFAACVLMPKAWVKSAFCSETQSIEKLAGKFRVSPKAMSYRLSQLGLTEPVDRCATNIAPTSRSRLTRRAGSSRRSYFRTMSTSQPSTSIPTGVLT